MSAVAGRRFERENDPAAAEALRELECTVEPPEDRNAHRSIRTSRLCPLEPSLEDRPQLVGEIRFGDPVQVVVELAATSASLGNQLSKRLLGIFAR